MPPSFLRNTLLGFGSGAAVALAGFIGNAITARILGPDDLGALAYVVFCVTIGSIVAGLGIGIVQQRYIPNLRAQGRNDEAEGLIGATVRLSLVAAVVGDVLLFTYLHWPGRDASQGQSDRQHAVILALALAWFMCWRLADTYQFYLRGEQRFGELARLSAVSAVVKLVAIGLGALYFGVAGAIAGYIAGNLLPAARIVRLLRVRSHVSEAIRRPVVTFAVATWATAVVGGLVFGRTEILFLRHYVGASAVGLFAAAATLAELAVQLPPLLLSALLPRFSEQHGSGEREHTERLYRAMTTLIAALIVPMCLGLAAISPVLMPLLFGADFSGSVPVAMVLLVAAAVSSLGVTTLYLLQGIGRTGLLLVSNALGLIGTIGLGFLLVPRFGLIGAAWSRGIVQMSVVLIETWYVTKRVGIAPPYSALGTIALAAAAQAGVAFAVVDQVGGVGSLLVAVPVAVVTFLVVLRLVGGKHRVDPDLVDRVVLGTPMWMRPSLTRILHAFSS